MTIPSIGVDLSIAQSHKLGAIPNTLKRSEAEHQGER